MSTIPAFLASCTEPVHIIKIADRYVSETCGICEQKGVGKSWPNPDSIGAEIFWPNPTSRWAHAQCLNVISAAESELIRTINKLFQGHWHRCNQAHSQAIGEIKKKCAPDSLLMYTEKNGVEAITHLFNTVGVEAAKKCAEEKRIQDAKDTGKCMAFAFAVSAIENWAAKL